MRNTTLALGLLVAFLAPAVARPDALSAVSFQQRKDYLRESEADQIREAYEHAERITSYVKFAEDRLEKFQEKGPELDTYKDTLLDAIDGTKEALTDVDNALKTAAPPPVRRKQP
jgi:hypothetical protein